ncbi:hypothetical protein RvY_13808 [Ramazzottius varieornatus]|uniref:Uncharacterized protein n=1 Tax=Ramazzottius varieornatus TaxID=947166 RepID=A0A1D1VXN8_RAMVA|nr:hypothetical protein RvY_13808 [Ramazzottius varieornatus]
MNDYPYRNEPGCDKARADEPSVVSYNLNVSYETLRVAVIDAVSKVLDVPNAEPAAVGPVDDYPGSSASPSPTFDVPESFRKFTLQGF